VVSGASITSAGKLTDYFNTSEFTEIINALNKFTDDELKALNLNDDFIQSLRESASAFDEQRKSSIEAAKGIQDGAIDGEKNKFNDFLTSMFEKVQNLIDAYTKLNE